MWVRCLPQRKLGVKTWVLGVPTWEGLISLAKSGSFVNPRYHIVISRLRVSSAPVPSAGAYQPMHRYHSVTISLSPELARCA